MGVIGVYDYDFMNYAPVIPNLECAKLCAYFQQKKEVTILVPTLEPERYTKIYIRKDYDDGKYSKEFFFPNVEYGGLAFSENKYNPLPEDIEFIKPNFEVYRKYNKNFGEGKVSQRDFRKILNSAHLRLSLDGQTVSENFEKQIKIYHKTNSIFFHDYDLNAIENSYNIIKDLAKRETYKGKTRNRRIGMKFPTQIYKNEDMDKWLDISPFFSLFYLQFNGIIDNEILVKFYEYNKSFVQQMNYNVGCSWYEENQFFKDVLPQIFKQVLFLRSHNTKITLVYDNNFQVDPRFKKLIRLLNLYLDRPPIDAQGGQQMKGTLYAYCASKKTKIFQGRGNNMKIEDMRDAFQLVREKNYEVFDMFYNWEVVEYKGGEMVNVTSRNPKDNR